LTTFFESKKGGVSRTPTLDPSSIGSQPDGLKSDVEYLVKLVGSDLTQDGAVEFSSGLLSLYVG
jgi:hypothetical protein